MLAKVIDLPLDFLSICDYSLTRKVNLVIWSSGHGEHEQREHRYGKHLQTQA